MSLCPVCHCVTVVVIVNPVCHCVTVVVIVNPGIKVEENYKPYTDGMEKKVFIMVGVNYASLLSHLIELLLLIFCLSFYAYINNAVVQY